MTLVHCAMLSEAIYIVEKYKLKLTQKNPRIYIQDNIILCVSGIGKLHTINTLNLVYKKYNIKKAINIGVAGCCDKYIKIGQLFCTTNNNKNIQYMNLKTVDTPQISNDINISCLYDMEAKYFEEISLRYVDINNIYIYKIVSDYLNTVILHKEFVKELIKQNIGKINQLI